MSETRGYRPRFDLEIDTLISEMREGYGRDFSLSGEPRHGYRSTVLFLTSGTRAFILKIVDGNLWQDRTIETLQTLRSLGLPVPETVSMRNGETAWHLRESVLVLYVRHPGRAPRAGDLDVLKEAGRTLARIHLIPTTSFDLPETTFRDIVQRTRNNAQEAGVSSDLPRLPDRSGLSEEPVSLLHGDYRGQNVLCSGGAVSCVLDWDDAVLGPRLFDLAYGALFFLSVIKDDPPSRDEVGSFLTGYHEVYPLTVVDRRQFPDYLATALHQGLTLWMSIREGVDDPVVNARLSRWIAGYASLEPILEGFTVS